MIITYEELISLRNDTELAEYKLLAAVKHWKNELNHNRLYPSIEEAGILLSKTNLALNKNLQTKLLLEQELNGSLFNEKFIVFDQAQQLNIENEKFIDFLARTREILLPVSEEAELINQFVKDNMQIINLSNRANFKGKGFFIVPNNRRKVLCIYKYETEYEWFNNELINNLTTTLLRAFPLEILDKTYQKIIAEFIDITTELYNPAVFVCQTDLDFPFTETILPVANHLLLDKIM
ncbi:MAG: hypothetical protein Kow0098_24790 [Ignavibacteriaceae bacterium]